VVVEGSDYAPIAQATVIRQLREENARLREQLRLQELGDASAELANEDNDIRSPRKKRVSSSQSSHVPDSAKYPTSRLTQRKLRHGDPSDSLYFGSPGMANVIHEVCPPFFNPDSKCINPE
jgi:hypothetical protein